MADKRKGATDLTDLIRTQLIVQLALAGLGQREIRAIAGCGIQRVNGVLKFLKPKRRRGKKA